MKRLLNRRVLRRRAEDTFVMVAALAAVALVIGGLYFFTAKVPCEFYTLAPAKDIPARCLSEFAS